MKLLITDGASGLGQVISQTFEAESLDLVSWEPGDVDWRDQAAVENLIEKVAPSFIINTAGWASEPDAEQQDTLLAAASGLAKACLNRDSILIHLSSFRVFDGEHKTSYRESESPEPASQVGLAFLRAEQAIGQQLERWICLRLGWVIGVWADNSLTELLMPLTAGDDVDVNCAYPGAPTGDHDIARILLTLVRQTACGAGNWGVFHYCSADDCSQADFARQVASMLEQDGMLKGKLQVLDEEPSGEAPGSAVLSSKRIADNFGVQPRSWRQGLHTMIKRWLRENELA